MERSVSLLNIGIAYPNPMKYKKTKNCTNRLHVPLSGSLTFKNSHTELKLIPGNAYLMSNSESSDLILDGNEPYFHFFVDFRCTPPLKQKDVVVVNLEKDESLDLLLKAAMALIMRRKGKDVPGHISPYHDYKMFVHQERILRAIISHFNMFHGLQFINNEKLTVALEFIEENYSRNIHNEDIAAAIGSDIRFLSRLFEKHLHVSPYHYLTQYRVDAAMRELRHGKSVGETTALCGFKSENTFREAFKRITGCSPTEIQNTVD